MKTARRLLLVGQLQIGVRNDAAKKKEFTPAGEEVVIQNVRWLLEISTGDGGRSKSGNCNLRTVAELPQ
jgi:hypothetical protein